MVRRRSPATLSKGKGLIINSYAKLNLYLEVLKKRRDNYHNIKTLFERIDLSDKIILKFRPDKKIKVTSNSKLIPKDKNNLAYRAARLLQKNFDIDKGIDIKIIKNIPVGSGMGGGSSNAASVLMGLNKLCRLNLIQEGLAKLAKKLGSDVPFFIYNRRFALGKGRGERITPINLLDNVRFWHILVVPNITISTAMAYKEWDKLEKNPKISKSVRLTRPKYDVKILPLALRKNDLSLIGKTLFNNLEQVSIRLYPELIKIKEKLRDLGVKSILMSGSGPAIFGIVSSRKEADRLSRQLKRQHSSWQVFATKTV